jgi:Zn-dependent peptidase ImmA (M78 family)
MSLRRGFKTEANRMSVSLRLSLGLTPEAPIDVDAAARKLGLIVVPLSRFRQTNASAVRQLSEIDPGAFSAATVPCGFNKRVIVHNDSHSRGRQRSNIAHEIAHVLLKHPFSLPIDTSGCRNVDRDMEDEAAWLGSVILIPNEAAMHIVRSSMDKVSACRLYGVSGPLLRMRINASGALIRIARAYH